MKIKSRFIIVFILITIVAILLPSCSSEPREITFRVNDDYIQWKYMDTDEWNNIISVSKLNESGALSGKSAYDIATAQGFEGSEDEWLASLIGKSGDSVSVGENGNWWIGGNDTGVSIIGASEGLLYVVPDFTGLSVSRIIDMPECRNFNTVFYGNISDNTVAYQSIPAGVVATKGTKLKLYMQGYDMSVEYPVDKPDNGDDNSNSGSTSTDSYEIELVSITSPVAQGKNATIAVRGKANTEYSVKVIYSSGASSAKGLEPKISDKDGNVSWTWKIGAQTSVGTYRIDISDGLKSLTAYIEITEAES